MDQTRARGDGRANVRVEDTTDFHSLHGKTGILGLDSRDIKTGPAGIDRGAKVEFTPSSSVTAIVISGDRRARGCRPATLGVGVEGVELRRASGKGEIVAGVTVPSVHLRIWPDLVPNDNEPVVGVGALKFHDVLVFAGV